MDSTNQSDSLQEEKSLYTSQPLANDAGYDTQVAASPARSMKPISWFFVVFSLLAALFLFALDNTIVADVQANIILDFGNIEKLPWISVAFALGAVSTNLFWGQLYCYFNNRLLFITGVVIFEVGSAICGAAPTLDALIVGRAICGIGGMGIYLGTINMVSALTTEVERPAYLGFVGLTWGIGTILGPIIGGAFADSPATWRWAFYINLCIGGLAAPVYFLLLPSTAPPSLQGLSFFSRIKRLDIAGAILSSGAIVTLVMAISFGGSVYEWGSGQIIGLFVCSGVLWIVFALQQRFSILTKADDRLFPSALLKSWEMNVLFIQMASAQVVVTVPIYFIPLYFQFAKGQAALESGVHLLPFVLLLVFAVMLNGAMMAKFGYYMPWYLVGASLALAGGALLYTIDLDTSRAKIYGYSILAGFGVGLFSQAGFPVAQVKTTPQLLPQAVAFIGIGQVGGITLALMVSNAIFLNRATVGIARILPESTKVVIQQAITGNGGPFLESLSSLQRKEVISSIIASIDEVFIMVIAAAALSLVLSLFMKREKLFLAPKE